MLIVKEGDFDKVGIYYTLFTCERCGCEFRASDEECETEHVLNSNKWVERETCSCPCCGLKVFK